ncbi:hypothetical protein IMZ31_21440 (plasmid) [Pontibacillus sp. ALD_SL1]|uniref:hypothetical protein n=1 Tax=Pontibacillus sp. ALD_SL1 TaxID=2777185 RepID=UPI001A964878|nr:hypothetical protein [Pontibacillus sp. ALD_SL1]QST02017.1 hypothetical protein IMZ31_21440 [Pontibacillus sp. ALD_SL1]
MVFICANENQNELKRLVDEITAAIGIPLMIMGSCIYTTSKDYVEQALRVLVNYPH